jgi:hypothetical protein
LLLGKIIRDKDLPVEYIRNDAEKYHERKNTCSNVELIWKMLEKTLLVAKLNTKTENNFEHRKQDCHNEDPRKNKRKHLLCLLHLTVQIRRNDLFQHQFVLSPS